jgi:hypothetical protein
MKQHVRIVVLLASGFLATTAAAQPKLDTCSGVLTDFNGELVLRAGREGICTFSADDGKKIAAICAKGHVCQVAGLVDLCRDSGECVEVSSIVSVRDVTATQRLSGKKRR